MRRSNGASDRPGRPCDAGAAFQPVLRALLLAALATWSLGAAPLLASDDDEKFVVIHAGRVIPIEGEEIAGGTVVIVNGKIRLVGKQLDYPQNAEIIDAPKETIMPGWVQVHSRWGLPSYSRSGVHGDLTAAAEYFPTEDQFEELLKHGFTVAALYPDGTGAPGRAVLLKTGGDIDRRVVQDPSYLRITLGALPGDKKTLRDAFKKAKEEIEKVEKARKEFEEKQKKAEEEAKKKEPESQPAEGQDQDEEKDDQDKTPETQPTTQPAEAEFKPPAIDPAHQVFVDLIQKKEGVFALVEIPSASNVLHFDDAVTGFEFDHRFFLPSGFYTDLDQIAEKLGEREAKVATYARLSRVPYTWKRLNLPAVLARAGCELTLVPMEDSKTALLAFRQQLAELVRSGLPRDEVLRALTCHPAALLGIEDRFGTLEKDKPADITFFDGDPLDPTTRVTRVMIDGKIVYEKEDRNR